MPHLPYCVSRLVLTGAFVVLPGPVSAQETIRTLKVDCKEVLEKMRNDIAIDPSRLVLAMEDALTTSELCCCAIVRTAVDLAGRDPALSSRILIAAIHFLPASSAQLTECVLLEAPSAATAIRAALAKELGEKSPELLNPVVAEPRTGSHPPKVERGSSFGKQPIPAPSPEANEPGPAAGESAGQFFPTLRVSGLYLTSPARANSQGRGGISPKIILQTTIRLKNQPYHPVSPVTQSVPE